MQVVSPGRLLPGSAAAASAAAASGSAPQPQQQKVVPVEQQKFFEVRSGDPNAFITRRSGMPIAAVVMCMMASTKYAHAPYGPAYHLPNSDWVFLADDDYPQVLHIFVAM